LTPIKTVTGALAVVVVNLLTLMHYQHLGYSFVVDLRYWLIHELLFLLHFGGGNGVILYAGRLICKYIW